MEEAGRIAESGAVGLSDQAWSEARRRAEVVGPLGEMSQVPDDVAGDAAEKLGLSKRMVYYLLRRWRQSGGSVVSLAPGRRGVRRGKCLLPQEVETVISVAITEVYLTRQRPTVTRLLEHIESAAGMPGCDRHRWEPFRRVSGGSTPGSAWISVRDAIRPES